MLPEHKEVAVEDAGMFLRPFAVRSRHPMVSDKNEQVCQSEAKLRRPIHHVDVRRVHPVVMNDVLTLEHDDTLRFEDTGKLAQAVAIMRFKFVVTPVSAEPFGHDHVSIAGPVLTNIGQERRVKDD